MSNLRIPSAGPVAGVDQDPGRAFPKGAFDLAEAGHDLARFGGDPKGFRHAPNQERLNIGRKRLRDAQLALEGLAKLVTPDGFRNHPAGGGEPHAASGQLALEIWNYVALRRNDEADQLVDRPDLPTDRAHPHGRGPFGPRSMVEFGVSIGEHPGDILLCP
ncbi:hypothetical protein ABH984_005263 [Bradyrhizobium ottawaense]